MTAIANKTRGVQSRGKGNHKNVTVARIRPEIAVDPEATSVVKATEKMADVAFSAGATAAWDSVSNTHGKQVGDTVAASAVEWAQARGSKRVWDIDIACAAGFDRTPEGAKAFRTAFGLRAPAVDWPTKVSETPQPDTAKGTVIDLETGKVRS